MAVLGDQEMYGLEIAANSGGLLPRPDYVLFHDMEERGLLVSRLGPGTWKEHQFCLPRRLYRVRRVEELP